MNDSLTDTLAAALHEIPLIDPHSHIEPLSPVSTSLDDILGYHYYTELAHSAGMDQKLLEGDPKTRCRNIVRYMSRYDNTAQYAWFIHIAQAFLGYGKSTITEDDADDLFDKSVKVFGEKGWEKEVFARTKLEKIFLTNEFDDPLEGFDTSVYVPCLRTDTLVMKLHERETLTRLAKSTGIEVVDCDSLRAAIRLLFERFVSKGAKACAISLPPWFDFSTVNTGALSIVINRVLKHGGEVSDYVPKYAPAVLWMLAEHCREFKLPFDLMIGVNRNVYPGGVHQGRDLYDRRTSLIQYRELFNAFPDVTFPVSVLTSGQNQELVSYSWIFPNVVCHGHWWYSNLPAYIAADTRERLQGVPKVKQIGYYSDAYKLEFVLPKFAMYRRVLAGVLADEFVRTKRLSETEAVALGKRILRDNVREIFNI